MDDGAGLPGQVRRVLDLARAHYRTGPPVERLEAAAARLEGPLRIGVAGRLKAGKSTLLNALVGQDLAATDARECTRVVTWYRDGTTYAVTAHPRTGAPKPLRLGPAGTLDIDLGGLDPDDVERIVVDWPSAELRHVTLVDTPGLESLTAELSERTRTAIAPDDGASEVDALVYLMRHVHATDVQFLEDLRRDGSGGPTVGAIGVLARADEIGNGHPDALERAQEVAARYRTHPQVAAACHTVLPVAGLLAATASGLRESEFRALGRIAGLPVDVREDLLLTAPRFARDDPRVDVPAAERAVLLDRLGVFGVRCAVSLIGTGQVDSATRLARELRARSGLERLRHEVRVRFVDRADTLRADAALRTLDGVLRRWPGGGAGSIRDAMEHLEFRAPDLVEVRAVERLRAGTVRLPAGYRADAEALLGAAGTDLRRRLGLAADATAGEVGETARGALGRWQRRAEHPGLTTAARQITDVVIRRCETMIREETNTPG